MSAVTFNTGVVWSLSRGAQPDRIGQSRLSRRQCVRPRRDRRLGRRLRGRAAVRPPACRRLIGTNDGPTAVSSGIPVSQLGPESMYAFEGGLKLRTRQLAGSLPVLRPRAARRHRAAHRHLPGQHRRHVDRRLHGRRAGCGRPCLRRGGPAADRHARQRRARAHPGRRGRRAGAPGPRRGSATPTSRSPTAATETTSTCAGCRR